MEERKNKKENRSNVRRLLFARVLRRSLPICCCRSTLLQQHSMHASLASISPNGRRIHCLCSNHSVRKLWSSWLLGKLLIRATVNLRTFQLFLILARDSAADSNSCCSSTDLNYDFLYIATNTPSILKKNLILNNDTVSKA